MSRGDATRLRGVPRLVISLNDGLGKVLTSISILEVLIRTLLKCDYWMEHPDGHIDAGNPGIPERLRRGRI